MMRRIWVVTSAAVPAAAIGAAVALATFASVYPLDGIGSAAIILAMLLFLVAGLLLYQRAAAQPDPRAAHRTMPPVQHSSTAAEMGRRGANLRVR